MKRTQVWVVLGLGVAVVISAMGLVQAKHESRQLTRELQDELNSRDAEDVEWGRLQLELSTLVTREKIEIESRERLNMREPEEGERVILNLRQHH